MDITGFIPGWPADVVGEDDVGRGINRNGTIQVNDDGDGEWRKHDGLTKTTTGTAMSRRR